MLHMRILCSYLQQRAVLRSNCQQRRPLSGTTFVLLVRYIIYMRQIRTEIRDTRPKIWSFLCRHYPGLAPG